MAQPPPVHVAVQVALPKHIWVQPPPGQLMADVALSPTFPDAEIERLRTRRISSIQSEKSSPGTIAQNTIQAAAALWDRKEFGGDRLGGIRDSALELNVLGPGQQLPYKTLDRIAGAIIPGVHGLGARVRSKPAAPPL